MSTIINIKWSAAHLFRNNDLKTLQFTQKRQGDRLVKTQSNEEFKGKCNEQSHFNIICSGIF